MGSHTRPWRFRLCCYWFGLYRIGIHRRGFAIESKDENSLSRARWYVHCIQSVFIGAKGRKDFWLPSHFQNLPLPFKMTLGGPSETFPWTLSRETYKSEVKFCHGSARFFGGRSMFWSAWSPQPPTSLMRDFPPAMKALTQDEVFWRRARELLNITSAADIDDTVYAGLQRNIDLRLQNISSVVPSADFSQPAQLALGRRSRTSTLRFNKFSVPGPMLAISERQRRESLKDAASPLQIMVQCTAKKMHSGEDNIVRNIETSRGDLSWSNDKTRVILCSGVIFIPSICTRLGRLTIAGVAQCHSFAQFVRSSTGYSWKTTNRSFSDPYCSAYS